MELESPFATVLGETWAMNGPCHISSIYGGNLSIICQIV
jgi:hypothetical protein